MIYVLLTGRIGNQLFMYALAENIRKQKLSNSKIIIDDKWVIGRNWENSLPNYELPNVKYTHDRKKLYSLKFFLPLIALFFYKILIRNKEYKEKFEIEKKYQNFFNTLGLIVCENGYLDYQIKRKNVLIYGYFQSEKYFTNIKDEIIEVFSLKKEINNLNCEELAVLNNRNSVCISIKVEHNVGDELYNVCTKEYWEKAIDYIIENVENPIFFICSDNVKYVTENLIDVSKYDIILQDRAKPVHISLAIMAQCNHFIIGNTTFGWWAQFLSNTPEKIVIAPKKWMNCDMPVDVYEDTWVLF